MDINSERRHFIMYWEVEKYDDGTRYVFCDELEEYTFLPYAGSLKTVPDYSEDKEALENIRIFLPIDATKKLVKIPCNIVEEHKKIYIEEGSFNKYWKLISENIYRGICRRGDGNNVSRESVNERVDLSLMETPARDAVIGKDYRIAYKGKEQDIEIQRLISKRAGALEDNRIRFVYAKSDNIVHDKTCERVEKIEYWNFCATENLPEDRELCPHCRKKIYIRNAIKNDTKHFSWYFRFFEKGKVSSGVLERFLKHGDTKLHMEDIDELIVKHKEDTWRIARNPQGSCRLYHNNYVMVNERERYITSGFHRQKHCPTYLPGILVYIEGYDWEKHLKAKEQESAAASETRAAAETSTKKLPLLRRIAEKVKRIFGKK